MIGYIFRRCRKQRYYNVAMREPGNTDIKVFGLPPEEHNQVRTFHQRFQKILTDERETFLPWKLSPEQHAQARETEIAAKEYLLAKMRRLGVPEGKLPNLPEVQFALRPKGKYEEEGGNYFSTTNIATVFKGGLFNDFFDSFSTVAHELSHASVAREVRFYFPGGKLDDLSLAGGMEIIGNRKRKASIIEEAMVILDEADFFHTFLKTRFPADYQKRLRWSTPERLRRVGYQEIDQSLYGELPAYLIVPFVTAVGPTIPVLGQSLHLPSLQPVSNLKEYLFGRKLCEVLGKDALGDKGDIDTEEAIRVGRDILDRDRYLRTNDAHRRIVKIVGGRNAKALFELRAHDNNIDNAMRILVSIPKAA